MTRMDTASRMRADDGEADMARWLKRADPIPTGLELENETRRAMKAARARLGLDAASELVAAFAIVPAPWGPLHVAASGDGIVAIELASETSEFAAGLERRLGGHIAPETADEVPDAWRSRLSTARRELEEYFAGQRSAFDLPVDLRGVSDWDRRVLAGAATLGFGELTSYGGLARMIGSPRAARAVGGALGRNPIPIVIPCHRIVAGDGRIGGYGGGGHGSRAAMLAVKQRLLAIEGAAVRM